MVLAVIFLLNQSTLICFGLKPLNILTKTQSHEVRITYFLSINHLDGKSGQPEPVH
jgi:hypothetical protein